MDASCVSSSDDETCVMDALVGRPLAWIRTLYTRSKKKAETEDKDFHKTKGRNTTKDANRKA